jgi:hypothetical protein
MNIQPIQWPRGLRRRSAAEYLWDHGFESQQGHGCLSLVSVCVVRWRSLRWANPSSWEVLPTVVCVWVWSSENKYPLHLLWTSRYKREGLRNETMNISYPMQPWWHSWYSDQTTGWMIWRPPSPPIRWVPGSFPGVNWPGHDADHSSPPSFKIKNEYSYTPALPVCLHGMDRTSLIFCFIFMSHGWEKYVNT